jgi:transaldolase
MSSKLARLRSLGQSVWIDDLRRDMIAGGELVGLRDQGVTGVTVNPTTFDRAVADSELYDRDIRRLAAHHAPAAVLWELLAEDVRQAADVLRPVYDQTAGADGYVSIEVSPEIAYDTARSLAMARDLWRRCGRPNVMVKIPATAEGLPAIREALSQGVNVNVTLTFSARRYREVAEAFLAGLEARRERGHEVDRLASVASFFVSRVDAKVDGLLRARIEEAGGGQERKVLQPLIGAAAVANAKLAYQQFRRLHAGPRWERLAAAGARPQRCLWASTSVKDPSFPPAKYVEALVGPDTVDTMPPATLRALAEARIEGPALERDLELAHDQVRRLANLGIDLEEVGEELEAEGVEAFLRSYRHSVAALAEKISERGWDRLEIAGQDSFPASDPPGWGGHTMGGPPRR